MKYTVDIFETKSNRVGPKRLSSDSSATIIEQLSSEKYEMAVIIRWELCNVQDIIDLSVVTDMIKKSLILRDW